MAKNKDADKALTKKKDEVKPSKEDNEILDGEELERLVESIPDDAVKKSFKRMTSMMSMSVSDEPPGLTKLYGSIAEKITPDHLTQLFINSDTADKRGFVHSIFNRTITFLLIVGGFAAILIVINMFKNDKALVIEIIKMIAMIGGGGLGGFGGGYYFASRRNR